MCRNIRTLFNFDPPATDEEITAASLQFVRKVSGYRKPSKANEDVFQKAISDISHIVQWMLDNLTTRAEPKNREEEKRKARARNAKRFGTSTK